MKVELAVACVAGAVALISATITTWTSFRVAERSSAREGQRKVTKYSEPLVRSAYDLQSRFYNILGKRLFEAYRDGVDERAKNYIVDSTVFLICQYLCWTELVRREIQFVDTGNRSKTSQISHLQDAISAQWGTDSLGPKLRIFSVEQRAVGEALIQPGAEGPECMGYGAFLKNLSEGADPSIDAIRRDVVSMQSNVATSRERLRKLQHLLIDLLKLLDPDDLRFPSNRRHKI